MTDPEKIAHRLPDLQDLKVADSKHFSATIKVGIAFVWGNFKFDFTLLDQTPPSQSKCEALVKGAYAENFSYVNVHIVSSHTDLRHR